MRSFRIQVKYGKFRSFRGQSPLTPTRSPDPWPCQGACAAPWTSSAISLENHFLGVLYLSERMKQKRKKKKKKNPTHNLCVLPLYGSYMLDFTWLILLRLSSDFFVCFFWSPWLRNLSSCERLLLSTDLTLSERVIACWDYAIKSQPFLSDGWWLEKMASARNRRCHLISVLYWIVTWEIGIL